MIIDTLSALRDARFSITAHCNGCQHSTVLDLDALIDRLGPWLCGDRQSESAGGEAIVRQVPGQGYQPDPQRAERV